MGKEALKKAINHQGILQRSPAQSPTPSWLREGEYDGHIWGVADSNPTSPKPISRIRFNIIIFDPGRPDEVCRLTDQQYAPLLHTIKLILYNLRTGKHARVTSASAHNNAACRLKDLAQWMIIHRIRRFSDLCRDDFNAYVEAATYGSDHLLKFSSRLAEHVVRLKEVGKEIPNYRNTNTKPHLDTKKLMQDAGIDYETARNNPAVCYELLKIADAEGFYRTPRQVARLSEGPPVASKLSSLKILQVTMPFHYLWRMRNDLMGDQIQFDPFDELMPMEMARKLGKTVGRTKTTPVRQMMELVNYSLWWVLVYAPVLLDLKDKWDNLFDRELSWYATHLRVTKILDEATLPEGPARPFPLDASTKRTPSGELNFGVAIQSFIPAACFVVIAAFSGRRRDEVLSIRGKGPKNSDCIYKDGNGLWIETYIEKTAQDWVRTPCNEAVAAAVQILRRWSASSRALSTNVKLFQYKQLTSDRVIPFRVGPALKQFVDFLPITQMPDGSHWNFTPHQCRRFFAIMYFWRYQFGDLASLSYHLQHFDPTMTQVYVTEPETGAIFRYVNKEYTTTILTEAAIGERNISGPFGERFKTVARKLRNHYRRLVRVISPKLAWKIIEPYVEKSGRRLKAFRWGYCACGTKPQQLRTARCLDGTNKEPAVAPDLSRADFITCGRCPHHVTEKVFEQYWLSELESQESVAADPKNGPILRAASRERAAELRLLHKRSFKNSKSLEALDESTR